MRYFPSLALFRSLLVSNRYLLKKKLPTLCSLGVETGTEFIGLSVSDTDLTYSSPLMTYVLGEQETPEMFGQFMEQLIRHYVNPNVGEWRFLQLILEIRSMCDSIKAEILAVHRACMLISSKLCPLCWWLKVAAVLSGAVWLTMF
ncbi:hypothetical protein Q3G72_025327 [Acer saccharum]|nr:hypothetical protein Q3G72_025327 [Acer saccharum]